MTLRPARARRAHRRTVVGGSRSRRRRAALVLVLAGVLSAGAPTASAGAPDPALPPGQEPDRATEPRPGDPEDGGGSGEASGEIGGQQAATDLLYATVPPCRIFDSRLFGGPFGPGESWSLILADVCEVPLGPAKAVMANVISVNASATGYLRARAYGPDGPEATVLNFNAGLVSSNAVPLPLCDIEATPQACTFDTVVRIPTGRSNIVVDIVGYFYEPAAPAASEP